jgi:hypothetical protein
VSNQIHYRTHDNATITATGQGDYTFSLPSLSSATSAVLYVDIDNAPTGTSPTLTVNVRVSSDGIHWANLTNTGALNSIGVTRVKANGLQDTWVQVHVVLGGTNPSFTGVTIDITVLIDD